MLLQGGTVAEHSCGFDDDVDPQLRPGEVCRVAFDQHGDLVVSDRHDPVLHLDLLGEATHHRVVLEEVGEDVVI